MFFKGKDLIETAKLLFPSMAQAISERQTVGGDPNNPAAANAAYQADPVLQEKARKANGGYS